MTCNHVTHSTHESVMTLCPHWHYICGMKLQGVGIKVQDATRLTDFFSQCCCNARRDFNRTPSWAGSTPSWSSYCGFSRKLHLSTFKIQDSRTVFTTCWCWMCSEMSAVARDLNQRSQHRTAETTSRVKGRQSSSNNGKQHHTSDLPPLIDPPHIEKTPTTHHRLKIVENDQ